jgi:hypothetical protein
VLLTLAIGLSAGNLLAQQIWKKKPASQWSKKEVLKILRKSPWAKEQRVAHPRVPVDPEVGSTIRVGRVPPPDPTRRPEFETEETVAWYLVRWESAMVMEKAFSRLQELGEIQEVAKLTPSPRLPEDRYVITVKTTTPPPLYPGILDRQTEWELKENAQLKVNNISVHPLEVEFGGTRTHPAAHFFFPRTYKDKPLLPSQGGKVEFRLKANLFLLRTKFKLPSESVD